MRPSCRVRGRENTFVSDNGTGIQIEQSMFALDRVHSNRDADEDGSTPVFWVFAEAPGDW